MHQNEWSDREIPSPIVLFDVDGTLTPSRKVHTKVNCIGSNRRNAFNFSKVEEKGCYWICWWFGPCETKGTAWK